jgi:hypothetical protein
MPVGEGWCVLWNHSVRAFRSRTATRTATTGWFWCGRTNPISPRASGISRPGRQVSDGAGGYLILDIDEPVPGNAYMLRPGAGPVDHRLSVGDTVVSLSAVAPRERVRIELTEGDD